MEVVHVVGRVIVGAFFLYNAFGHFTGAEGMAQYARSKGVPAPKLAILGTGVLLLLGGLSLLLGWYPLWGIGLLTLFLVPVTFQMHDFWNAAAEARQGEQINFLKNLAILGALWALVAVPQPWPYSLGG